MPFQSVGKPEGKQEMFLGLEHSCKKLSSSRKQLPPQPHSQDSRNPEDQQQISSASMSVTAEKSMFEENPGSWSPARGPAFLNKAKKSAKTKAPNTTLRVSPTLASKPVKFTIFPVWQRLTSMVSNSKVEFNRRNHPIPIKFRSF